MRIHELDPQVANQIAAGEVVERPASVVKELVENAIDAEATEIDIEIQNAGLNRIQVTDNGVGMSEGDAVLAFKRHATSKIQNSRDLFRVRTLGFRGEALPSIASVSEVDIETSDGETGTHLSLQDGEVVLTEPSHLRKGTSILVENLFYNTPARLKYIKSLQTELNHITDIVNREAMGHPHICFRYQHDGKVILETNGKGETKEILSALYGYKNVRDMLLISGETPDFVLNGFISLPNFTRASKQYISIYLNGRYIRNYKLSQAVISGYGSKLMVGRYPVAVISIEIDPQLLDVNVHPTKQEVRISKEEELYQLIQEAIKQQLGQTQRIPEALGHTVDAPVTSEVLSSSFKELEGEDVVEQSQLPLYQTTKLPDSSHTINHREKGYHERISDQLYSTFHVAEPTVTKVETEELYREDSQTRELENQVAPASEGSSFNPKQKVRHHTFPELDYVGQLQATYLVTSDGQGMYLIDQHAAQERIKYEYYREEIASYGTAVQELLVPIILDYTQSEVSVVTEMLPELNRMGIQLESFGQNSFALTAHPIWMGENHIKENTEDIIQWLIRFPNSSVKEFRETTAIMMACRLSIKANHYLDDKQAKQLIHDLAYCENPYNCPHGRPVMVHFSDYEIERMFKRIQDPHQSKKYGEVH